MHVHHECLSGDALGALRGRGVVVYLRGGEHIGRLRQPSTGLHDHAADLDLAAAILRDLDVRSTVAAVGCSTAPHRHGVASRPGGRSLVAEFLGTLMLCGS